MWYQLPALRRAAGLSPAHASHPVNITHTTAPGLCCRAVLRRHFGPLVVTEPTSPESGREIAFSLGTSDTQSRTHRMSDIFDEHKEKVERCQQHFAILPTQVGYCAAIDNVFVAFEVFGAHETLAAYWPKLLNGLAMEALLSPDVRTKKTGTSRFRKAVIAEALAASVFETYPSIGEGQDVRISGRWQGSALLDKDRVEHCVLYSGAT